MGPHRIDIVADYLHELCKENSEASSGVKKIGFEPEFLDENAVLRLGIAAYSINTFPTPPASVISQWNVFSGCVGTHTLTHPHTLTHTRSQTNTHTNKQPHQHTHTHTHTHTD